MIPRIPSADDLQSPPHRNGDDRFAHVGPGEMVIPNEFLRARPDIAMAIVKALEDFGADPRSTVVGSPDGNYNPETGHQEFFLDDMLPSLGIGLLSGAAGLLPYGEFIAPIVAGGGTYLSGGSVGESIGAGLGAAIGSSAGARSGLAGETLGGVLGDYGSFLPDFVLDADLGGLVGTGLGSVLGGQIGASFDPREQEMPSLNLGNTSPTALNYGLANAPAPGLTQNELPNITQTQTPYLLGAQGNGITYYTAVQNRDTGERELRPSGVGQLDRDYGMNRRGSFGGAITF